MTGIEPMRVGSALDLFDHQNAEGRNLKMRQIVPGTSTCVKTHDYSPLEPDASESKFYAPGIGVIVVLDDNDPAFRERLIGHVSP